MHRNRFIEIAALFYTRPKEHDITLDRLSPEELLEYKLLKMFWLREQEVKMKAGLLH